MISDTNKVCPIPGSSRPRIWMRGTPDRLLSHTCVKTEFASRRILDFHVLEIQLYSRPSWLLPMPAGRACRTSRMTSQCHLNHARMQVAVPGSQDRIYRKGVTRDFCRTTVTFSESSRQESSIASINNVLSRNRQFEDCPRR
jgi:hypothetical protein